VEGPLVTAYLPPPLLVTGLAKVLAPLFLLLLLLTNPLFPSLNFVNSENGSLLLELGYFIFSVDLEVGKSVGLLLEDPMIVLGFLQSHLCLLVFRTHKLD